MLGQLRFAITQRIQIVSKSFVLPKQRCKIMGQTSRQDYRLDGRMFMKYHLGRGACVRACAYACVCACVYACVRVCVGGRGDGDGQDTHIRGSSV